MAALEPAFGRKVGIGHDEAFAHGVRADGLQEEALAAAVTAHKEPEGGAAIGDEREVGKERVNLGLAPDRDVRQADARHHAALERVDDYRGDALGHARRSFGCFHVVCHASTPLTSSS